MFTTNLGDLVPTMDAGSTALIDLGRGGHVWSYRRLSDTAASVGAGLLRRGLERGERVALIGENSATQLAALLGVMQAGLVAVPINYKLPAATVASILDDCKAAMVLADTSRATLADDRPCVLLDDVVTWPAATRGWRPVEPGPSEWAEILYTSGSTGRPRGVALSHRGQIWALAAHRLEAPGAPACTVIAAPMFHMNALFASSVALINRVRIVLLPRFEAAAWLRAISAHRCTSVSGIPSMFALAARERELLGSIDLGTVEQVSVGSSPLTDALVERIAAMFPAARIRNGYGTTEAGPTLFGDPADGRVRPILSVGVPMPGVEWRLLGGTRDEGVLEVRTPAVFEAYVGLPELTAEKKRDGWYRTGDVLRRDSEGFFYFVGREDDMFVCGGENLYPAAIERLLERHESVMQAAVLPIPDSIKGAIPIAFVRAADGRTLDPQELKQFALTHGPAYAHPRAVVVVDELPLNGAHKVDKRALASRALEVGRALGRQE